MTKPRARHTATNILWGLLCAAVIPVTSAGAQSSEPGARTFSRVRAVTTTERAQFEIARRLSVQPASARHLLFLGDVKLIGPLIERALVEEIRYARKSSAEH